MKLVFKIVFLLLFVRVGYTQVPLGAPTVNAPGSWYKIGWVQGENGLIHANKDTNAYVPRFAGTTVYRPNDGKLYYYDSVAKKWQKLSIGSDVPINIATASLTATGNWVQNWNNKQLLFNKISQLGIFTTNLIGGTIYREANLGTVTNQGLTMESYAYDSSNASIGTISKIGVGKQGDEEGVSAVVQDIFGIGGAARIYSNRFVYDINNDSIYFIPGAQTILGVNSGNSLAFKLGTGIAGEFASGGQLSLYTVPNGASTDSILVKTTGGEVRKTAPISSLSLDQIMNSPNKDNDVTINDASFFGVQQVTNFGTSLTRLAMSHTGALSLIKENQTGDAGMSRIDIDFDSVIIKNSIGNSVFNSIKLLDTGLVQGTSIQVGSGVFVSRSSSFNTKTDWFLTSNYNDPLNVDKAGFIIDSSFNIIDTAYKNSDTTHFLTTDANGVFVLKKAIFSSGLNNANIGSGFRVMNDPSLQTLRTLYNSNTLIWDSTSNSDGLTAKVDTSVIATQYDLTQVNTNLSNTPTATDVTINSSTGTGTTIPGASFTDAGVFTARDKQMLDSAFKAFKNSYSGDTSLVFGTCILRPNSGNFATGDTLKWVLLGISDAHDTLYITGAYANPTTGYLIVRYPPVARVLFASANSDESLSSVGVYMGASVGTDSLAIRMYVNAHPGSLFTATGNGTGWSNGAFVWTSGTTVITPGQTLSAFDAYMSGVEYVGSNNYSVKYLTGGVANFTVRLQLWDRTTNTQVTTAPTASDILLYRRAPYPQFVNLYAFSNTRIQEKVFGFSGTNQNSLANIWVFWVGKRSI